MFIILIAKKIYNLPPTYILRRWIRGAKRSGNMLSTCHAQADGRPSIIIWKNIFYSKANTCIIKVSYFDECYDKTIVTLDNIFACLENVKKLIDSVGNEEDNDKFEVLVPSEHEIIS